MAGVALEFAGWNGWQVPGPLPIDLNDVGLRLAVDSQSSFLGRASGRLKIGIGNDVGAIRLLLELPYDTTAFELSYEPSDEQKPTVGALVSFLFAGWTLPDQVDKFAREIEINAFAVRVGKVDEVQVAVAAQAGKVWPLVREDPRFTLSDVFLELAVASNRSPAGQLGAKLKIGNGYIPLVVALQGSWTTFTISLQDKPDPVPTLPSVGDIADLIADDWGKALPSEIANLGAHTDLRVFTFGRMQDGWLVEVAIGTKDGWLYKPIPNFEGVIFTRAAIAFVKPTNEAASGRAALDATVFGIFLHFYLIVPQAVLLAEIESGRLNLGALCEYVLGVTAPKWLADIGLLAVTLAIEWRERTYTLSALLARDIELLDKSSLRNMSIMGVIAPSGKKLCVAAEWVPAGGEKGIRGELCYPFECFYPIGSRDCIKFPPKAERPNPNPDKDPASDAVQRVVAATIAAGIAVAVMAAAAYGASATQTVAAVVRAQGAAVNVEQLAVSVRKAYNFTGQPSKYLGDFLKGFPRAGQPIPRLDTAARIMRGGEFSPIESAPALRGEYAASATPEAMVGALRGAWADTIGAPTMTRALAFAKYEPIPCALPIQRAYQLSAVDFATAFGLAGFSPALVPVTLAKCLREGAFAAGGAIEGIFHEFSTLPIDQLVSALAGVRYTPVEVAPALLRSVYGPSVASAGTMSATLVRGYRQVELETMLLALAACPFQAYAALPAAVRVCPPTPPWPRAALALGHAYPGIDPQALAVAFAACGLSSTQIGEAVRALYPSLPDVALRQVLGAVTIPTFAAVLAAADQQRTQGSSAAKAAVQLQAGWPKLTIYSLVATIGAVYRPPLEELALATVAASPDRSPVNDPVALLLSAPTATSPTTLAGAYLRALVSVGADTSAVGMAMGLTAAVGVLGRSLDATATMGALHAGYASTGLALEPTDAVEAISVALRANVLEAMQALVATYTRPPIDPGTCALAVASGLHNLDPHSAAVSLILVFGLELCPTATGALALAMWRGGFTSQTTLAVLPGAMKGWSIRDTRLTDAVFTEPVWWVAYTYRVRDGLDIVQVAVSLESVFRDLWIVRTVEILSAVFALVTPDTAATPMACALRAIGTMYQEALKALQAFFAKAWTQKNTQEVERVYGGGISA
jgi:hypothetical protein